MHRCFHLALQMNSFMMGVIMGLPPSKDKELREHQKSQTELRGMSRKLAHVAGTSRCVLSFARHRSAGGRLLM